MYNYFAILDNLQEELNMLRYSPTCAIVFDKNAEIIDINKAASDFFKIKNIEDYTSRKLKLEIDNQFYKITEDLKIKKILCNEKFKFKLADKNSEFVNLKISLFYGLKDMYLFQFSGIAPTK